MADRANVGVSSVARHNGVLGRVSLRTVANAFWKCARYITTTCVRPRVQVAQSSQMREVKPSDGREILNGSQGSTPKKTVNQWMTELDAFNFFNAGQNVEKFKKQFSEFFILCSDSSIDLKGVATKLTEQAKDTLFVAKSIMEEENVQQSRNKSLNGNFVYRMICDILACGSNGSIGSTIVAPLASSSVATTSAGSLHNDKALSFFSSVAECLGLTNEYNLCFLNTALLIASKELFDQGENGEIILKPLAKDATDSGKKTHALLGEILGSSAQDKTLQLRKIAELIFGNSPEEVVEDTVLEVQDVGETLEKLCEALSLVEGGFFLCLSEQKISMAKPFQIAALKPGSVVGVLGSGGGRGESTGHWFVRVKGEDGKWYQFNGKEKADTNSCQSNDELMEICDTQHGFPAYALLPKGSRNHDGLGL